MKNAQAAPTLGLFQCFLGQFSRTIETPEVNDALPVHGSRVQGIPKEVCIIFWVIRTNLVKTGLETLVTLSRLHANAPFTLALKGSHERCTNSPLIHEKKPRTPLFLHRRRACFALLLAPFQFIEPVVIRRGVFPAERGLHALEGI